MRGYIRSALAGLVFGLAALCSVAIAQTFVQSIQLSQDARGNFGVDSSGNLYLLGNRHLLFQPSNSNPPTVTGTACVMTANSTDANGQLTACSGAANVVTFGQAYTTAPRCVVTTSNATNVALTAVSTTTTLTIVPNTNGAGTWNWVCGAVS